MAGLHDRISFNEFSAATSSEGDFDAYSRFLSGVRELRAAQLGITLGELHHMAPRIIEEDPRHAVDVSTILKDVSPTDA